MWFPRANLGHWLGTHRLLGRSFIGLVLGLCAAFAFVMSLQGAGFAASATSEQIMLPDPITTGKMSVEEALLKRRSVRSFDNKPLNQQELSQLLWAAQGVTSPEGYRTAPSAGALYPLSIYAVVGRIASLAPGIYKYEPSGHQLHAIRTGDLRGDISAAALGQDWLRQAPVSMIVAAEVQRTTRKYGERGKGYVQIEAGHVAQNIYLQATALNLGATVVGAFRDDKVKAVLSMPDREDPICIVPVGRAWGGYQ